MGDLKVQIGCFPLKNSDVDNPSKPVRIVGIALGVLQVTGGVLFLAGAFAISEADLIGGILMGSGVLLTLPLIFVGCQWKDATAPLNHPLSGGTSQETSASKSESSSSESTSALSESSSSSSNRSSKNRFLSSKQENNTEEAGPSDEKDLT